MMDASPRPLPQQRLSKLVHGLRVRLSGSQQKSVEQIQQLSTGLAELDNARSAQLQLVTQQRIEQRNASTTNWDDAVHDCWDQAELLAYRAVVGTSEQEGKLRRRARQQIDLAAAEAKKRIEDIEKRFMRAKDVPIRKLNATRTRKQQTAHELHALEEAAQAALVHRSLGIPNEPPIEVEFTPPADSASALQLATVAVSQAERHCDRLTNNSLARFFESFWWLGLCGLVFAIVSGVLSFAGITTSLVAIVTGAIATVVVLVLGFVGVRPWLKRAASAEYPKLRGWIEHGEQMAVTAERLAVSENDNELKRLAQKRDDRFSEAKQWREAQVAEITKSLDAALKELRDGAAAQKIRARDQLTSGLENTNGHYAQQLQTEAESSNASVSEVNATHEQQSSALRSQIDALTRGGALRLQIATQKALQSFARSHRWCQEFFPSWESVASSKDAWPTPLAEPILPLGMLPVSQVQDGFETQDLGAAQLEVPLLFSPVADRYLTISGEAGSAPVQHLVRNILLRALAALPPGKFQICVIDPPGMGQDFGWLMHLSDFDPELVSHRVWTQTGHITKQLAALALAAEDFIQQSLRNQYQNIVEYNQDAGALAEPYRVLVWYGFPNGMDDQSWKHLQSILDSGARCGIVPILVMDAAAEFTSASQLEQIKRRGIHLEFSGNEQHFRVKTPELAHFAVLPGKPATDEQARMIVQEVGRRSLQAHRVEVPIEKMLPERERRWTADSSLCLEIPIGQSGVGRTHALKLGIGTAQHAILAGKTGSGKSSLLHAIISSAALKYSPDDLRLVLLDFKKGVEFQVYSDARLPHADIIGIESHREFGVSALQYVDGCMQRRGELFRSAGVQDLASWNHLSPEHKMPRILVVIDEFQELFVEDDKVSAQASMILDRIVRQGRSFGVHAVLSSQTLAGAYSLPRTTLGQMAVRIALQCDASDAAIIFSDDNPAAARLKHPGQAIYNDAGGRIEGNQPMQIGWLPKNKQVEWFKELDAGYANSDKSTNLLGRTVVYDGNRAATWDDNNAELAIDFARREVNADALWCITGESVAINPAVAFPLTQQAGRNILLVGADDAQAAAVMDVINASFVRSVAQRGLENGLEPQIFTVQGAKPTDARSLTLPKKWSELSVSLTTVDARDVDGLLGQIHAMLQSRMSAEDSTIAAPVLLNLIQIGRMRTLRKSDDFSFGESEASPDKLLEEILRDGPSHGIHVLVWAESYSTVNRWLSRSALRELEIRLLMQMSGSDSTNLVDTIAASRLGEHVMLLYDEATGQEQQFRPFSFDTLNSLADWVRKTP